MATPVSPTADASASEENLFRHVYYRPDKKEYKVFNKLATLALSGMMVMSMAVPAFATPQKANE